MNILEVKDLMPFILGEEEVGMVEFDDYPTSFPKYYCPTINTPRDFNKMRKSCAKGLGMALVHKRILFKPETYEAREVFFKTYRILELIYLNDSKNYVFLLFERGMTDFTDLSVFKINNEKGVLEELPFSVSWDLIIFPNEGIREDHELFESSEDAFLYWSPDDLFSKTRSENGLVLSGGREYSDSEIENANCRIKQFCDNFPVYDKKLVSEFLL